MNASSTTYNKKISFTEDIIFIICAASFAILTFIGMAQISANGVVLDSDLQTYAQGMAGERFPDLFANDPVLHKVSTANDIVNLERMLGTFLTNDNNFGIGLLKAGCIAIFVFYTSWYFLGRYLFKSPALAATLALASGVTVWVGFGTFWGITHSDPVPRVFYAAIFPLLLLFAIYSCNKPPWRPLCMLCAGLTVWIHAISALNCGAMLFCAFLFIKPAGYNFHIHLRNLFWCLVCFLAPVLVFLWPSLIQNQNFDESQLKLFRELFELRWHEDYGDISGSMKNMFLVFNNISILLLCGVVSYILALVLGNYREKTLCRMIPPFLAALALVCAFSWAESHYAPEFGRLPMGHELVRGIRFIIPIAWVITACAVSCLTNRLVQRIIFIVSLALVLIFTDDRQYMGFQYEIYKLTGLQLPLVQKAKEEMKNAQEYKSIMDAVHEHVPAGEAVFSDGEDMALRFVANRPLIYTFKDGYAHFYNKDYKESSIWLEYTKKMRANKSLDAWLDSGAPWFLVHTLADRQQLLRHGEIVFDRNGWMLVHRK